MGKTKYKTYPYTWEEFKSHFEAMPIVRDYEYVQNSYQNAEALYLGSEKDPDTMIMRIADYFAQQYQDQDERLFKLQRFYLALSYSAQNVASFEESKLAFTDIGENPAYISEAVLRALHKEFCSEKNPDFGIEPAKIVALARGFEAEK